MHQCNVVLSCAGQSHRHTVTIALTNTNAGAIAHLCSIAHTCIHTCIRACAHAHTHANSYANSVPNRNPGTDGYSSAAPNSYT